MLQRIALLAGSLAAAVVLAFGFAAAGLAPTPAPAPVAPTSTLPSVPGGSAPSPQVDTVYLTTPAVQTVVVKKVVHGGGEEGEHDGSETGEGD